MQNLQNLQNIQGLHKTRVLDPFQEMFSSITGTSGLVAYYPLNETSGNAINRAPATFGTLDGTVTGTTRSVAGQVGNAYNFDGIDDQVEVANLSAQIDVDTSISMFGLIKPTAVGTDGFFGVRNADTDDNFYILGLNATSVEYRFRNSAGDAYTITATVPSIDGVWSSFALVLSGANLTAYHNGVSVGTPVADATGSIGSATRSFFIGQDGAGSNVAGLIQHVAVFNTALSAGTILGLTQTAGLA